MRVRGGSILPLDENIGESIGATRYLGHLHNKDS